jgi:hypothetical protein
MPGYTKLFGTLIGSTVWLEDYPTKIVWITLLAMADQDGLVGVSLPGLAHLAGVTLAEAECAIEKFLAPDRFSRSPENDGRRIAVVKGGWRLLNYDKYRFAQSGEDAKIKAALRQKRYRERTASRGVTSVSKHNASVTASDVTYSTVTNDESNDKAEAEAEARYVTHSGSSLPTPTVTKYKQHISPSARSKKPRPEGGVLHDLIRTEIQKLYLSVFAVKCSWDGREGTALKKMLQHNPSWTWDNWLAMIQNYFASEKITGDRPSVWLPNISRFAQAPVDRYGKSQIAPSTQANRQLEIIRNNRTMPDFGSRPVPTDKPVDD